MICKLSKNKDKQHLDKPKISVYTPNLKEHLQRSFGILAGTTTSAAVVAFPHQSRFTQTFKRRLETN